MVLKNKDSILVDPEVDSENTPADTHRSGYNRENGQKWRLAGSKPRNAHFLVTPWSLSTGETLAALVHGDTWIPVQVVTPCR